MIVQNNKDFIMPADLAVEKSVLASCLLENNCIDIANNLNVTHESFYNPLYRTIYEVIFTLYKEKASPVDIITLGNELKLQGKLQSIGGKGTLVDLSDSIATTANLPEWCKILKKYEAIRHVIISSNTALEMCKKQEKPILEIIGTAKENLEKATAIAENKCFATTIDKLRSTALKISAIMDNPDKFVVPWCLYGMSNHAFKHAKKELLLIGAEPNIGKTGLALSVLLERVKRGYTDCIFCGESPSETLMMRLISIYTDIPADIVYEKNKLTKPMLDKMADAVRFLKDNADKFYIFGAGDYKHSLEDIDRKINIIQEKTGGKLDGAWIDYLQNMRPAKHLYRNGRVEQIEYDIEHLKEMFIKYNVAGTVLSQINRDKERSRRNSKYGIADLKGSSAIEQASDYILFMQRDRDLEGRVPVDLYSRKVRGSQIIKDIQLDFNTHVGKFHGVLHRYSKEDERV